MTGRARGITTVQVLLVLAALTLLVGASLASVRAGQRARAHEEVRLERAQHLGLALAEAAYRLRGTEGPQAATPGMARALRGPGTRRDSALGPVTVTSTLGPWHETCVARGPGGRPAAFEVSVVALVPPLEPGVEDPLGPRLTEHWPALAAACLAQGVEPGVLESAPAELVARLSDASVLDDADTLRARLQHPGSTPWNALVPTLSTLTDPHARLRRTLVHPARLAGEVGGLDRGGLRAPGPVFDTAAGATLELHAQASDALGTWRVRRLVAPLGRLRLRVQADWSQPSVDQPGGLAVTCGLGPEVLDDQDWRFEPGHRLPLVRGGPLRWRDLGVGWLGLGPARLDPAAPAGRLGGGATGVASDVATGSGDDGPAASRGWWVPRHSDQPPSAVTLPLGALDPPVAVAAGPRTWLVRGTDRLWWGSGDSGFPHTWQPGPTLAVGALVSVGPRAIAISRQGDRVYLITRRAEPLAERALSVRGPPLWLPGLRRLAIARADGPGWWLVGPDLEVEASTLPAPPPGTQPDPVPDGRTGIWAWWNGQLHHVDFAQYPGSGSTAVPGPVVALAPLNGRSAVALLTAAGHIELWRATRIGPVPCDAGPLDTNAVVGGPLGAGSSQPSSDPGPGAGTAPAIPAAPVAPAAPQAWDLASSGTSLLLGAGADLWRFELAPVLRKHTHLDAHLLLVPEPDPAADPGSAGVAATRRLAAPLVGTLEASVQGPALPARRLAAAGTANRGGSVLDAQDLSDLVVDGLYLDPLRGETLRFASHADVTLEGLLPLAAAEARLLVKVACAAPQCPDPGRPRTLVRLRQQAVVRCQPTLQWFLATHPAPPAASAIAVLERSGPGARSAELVSTLVRDPAARVWRHERRLELHGPPWVVQARTADGSALGSPLVLDQVSPVGVLHGVAQVNDDLVAGEWGVLAWGWRAGGEPAIALSVATPAHSSVVVDAVGDAEPSAVEATVTDLAWFWGSAAPSLPVAEIATWEAGDWVLEIGGPLGEKAFRGVVQGLRIDATVPDGTVPDTTVPGVVTLAPRVFAEVPARGCWWVVPGCFEAGARLRAIQALGIIPHDAQLEWRVELWGANGISHHAGVGRSWMGPAHSFAEPTRCAVWIGLRPDAAGRRTPLVEGIQLVWEEPERVLPLAEPVRVAPQGSPMVITALPHGMTARPWEPGALDGDPTP